MAANQKTNKILDEFLSIELAKRNFYEFCLFFDPEFFTPGKPHLKKIAAALQRVHEGKVKKLGISTPPRWGKSYIVSLFCAWTLGHNPSDSVMRNSYAAKLAEKFSYDVRTIIQSEKFKKIFPSVVLSDDKKSVTGWNLDTARQVSYFCSGVGGSITGFGASKLAILDDPIKNWEDAMSERILEKTLEWYESTHRTRMEGNCAEIHIATRWSKRDIIGVLTDRGEFDEVIVVQALDEKGNSNCEEIHTSEYYKNEEAVLDKMIFQAVFQQQPIDAEGILFPWTELKRFSMKDFRVEDVQFRNAAIDLAYEGTDSTCMPIGYTIGNITYITDVIFTTDNIDVTGPLCKAKILEHNLLNCVVECNAGAGIFVVQLRNDKDLSKTYIVGRHNTTNKHTRILMRSGNIKTRYVFRDDYEHGSNYHKFMLGLTTYMKNGSSKHDDAPDGLALLDEFLNKIIK